MARFRSRPADAVSDGTSTGTRGVAGGRVEWANALRGVAALSVLVAHLVVVFFTSQDLTRANWLSDLFRGGAGCRLRRR